jgi:hypothetical protein
MMKMKKLLPHKTLIRALLLLAIPCLWGGTANAQVKGISYTLSPTGDYVFWNENTGISDGLLVGGQLGFGFGEFVELRANYMQSANPLQRNFNALSTNELRNLTLDTINVGVQRWGGDLKINLARGAVVPYLTVGTGVQTLSPDSLTKYKNIYVSAGAGLQFSLGDRLSLGVQALNTSFNDSPVRSLTSEAERTANGLTAADYPNELLKNWSVRTSLILYLGGRRPGELSELDKAYLNNFSSGVSLPIEVTAGQLNFDKSLPYANTRFIGVSSGFNFGPYVGIRGFYWRGMEQGYFSTVDRLALYGGEGKFKLSSGTGLTPSINVGGGVIDALDGYQVNGQEMSDMDNKPFVSGGLGLDFPFSRALKLSAYAKALLTPNDLLENAANPDELATSWAYGLSLNLLIGNGAKSVEDIRQNDYDKMVMENLQAERKRSADLLDNYEERINELNEQISEAQDNDNTDRANALKAERRLLQNARNQLSELRTQERKANREALEENDPMLISMQPSTFSSRVDNIDRNFENNLTQLEQFRSASRENFSELDKRLRSIEDKLDSIQNEGIDYRSSQEEQLDELKEEREKSLELMKEYNNRLKQLEDQIQKALNSGNVGEANARSNERREIERRLQAIQRAQEREAQANQEAMRTNDPTRMNMTADEFRALLNESRGEDQKSQRQMERSMQQFQRNALREINQMQRTNQNLLREYRQELEREMEGIRQEISQLRTTTIVAGAVPENRSRTGTLGSSYQALGVPESTADITYLSPEQRTYESQNLATDGFFNLLNYDGMSVFGGFNVGGTTTFNLGFRSHYRYKNTDFFLMPETFLGMGSATTYGLLLNATYEIKFKQAGGFNPYVGLGGGLLRIGPIGEERLRLGSNIILGANLFKVAGGRLYVDFSARNLFRYNQIVAGYRLPF